MGVKGVSTMIMKVGGPFCNLIRLEEAVQEWREEHETEDKPVLVIDGMSVVHDVYASLDVLCQEFCDRMLTFTDKLAHCGVEPVFHFDGSVDKARHRVWVERRQKQLKEIEILFELLKSCPENVKGENAGICAGVPSLSPFIIKYICNVPVYQSLAENDSETAAMALSLGSAKCIGVLSNDTDFLFYDLGPGVHFFLIGRQDQPDIVQGNTLLCHRCKRDAFCQWMGVNEHLLPLIACLMGNDSIPYSQLRDFHDSFRKHKGYLKTDQLIRAISRWLSDPAAMQYPTQEALIANIQQRLLLPQYSLQEAVNVYSSAIHVQELKDSLALKHESIGRSNIDLFVDRHHDSSQSAGLLSVISSDTFYGATCHENPSITGLPSVHTLLHPVLERVYGFILGPGIEKTIYYASPGVPVEVGIKLVSKSIDSNVTLKDCFTKSCSLHDKFVALTCLWGLKSINIESLSTLPPHLAIWSVLLRFLRQSIANLEDWEFIALIRLPLVLQTFSVESLSELVIDGFNPRCIHLCSIINRGLVMMHRTLGATNYPCALQSTMPWQLCDGKLFQSIYNNLKGGLFEDIEADICNPQLEDHIKSLVMI